MTDSKRTPDYSPPGWLITWFDQVRLDPQRAALFDAYRRRLCHRLGSDNEACEANRLWMEALDLLLAQENIVK